MRLPAGRVTTELLPVSLSSRSLPSRLRPGNPVSHSALEAILFDCFFFAGR
jgi:hypothetical protein